MKKATSSLKRLMSYRESMIFFIFLALCITTTIVNPVFIRPSNLLSIARSVSLDLLPAIGVTLVISAGSIDLSCGATLGLVGIVFGYLYGQVGMNVFLAAAIGLAVAAAIGFCIGNIVSRLKVPPMIVTLAFQKICRGLIDIIAGGRSMSGFSENFNKIGQGDIFGIPYTIFYAMVFLIAGFIFTKKTVCGRIFIAMGGNEEATRLSGINVTKYKIISHIVCSVLAGISGIILASRLGSAQPTAGTSQDLNVIAACVLGGNSLSGGVATVFGTFLGVAIMSTITVSLTLMHVNAYWQNVCVGIILVIAICIDQIKAMAKKKA